MLQKKTKLIVLVIVPMLIMTLIAGCGSGQPATTPVSPTNTTGTTTTPSGQSVQVEIRNFAYSPQSIEIAVGTTVTWTNNDSVAHTATSNQDTFDSGTMVAGQKFSFTFNTPGTYDYICTLHPYMTGTVDVN